jgi:hypothetical protein
MNPKDIEKLSLLGCGIGVTALILLGIYSTVKAIFPSWETGALCGSTFGSLFMSGGIIYGLIVFSTKKEGISSSEIPSSISSSS